MRGLLPGCKQADLRYHSHDILAPRFLPTLTQEQLAALRAIELGKEKPPRILIEQNLRLVVIDKGEIKGQENFDNWKLLYLAAFSYVPVKLIQLSNEEVTANGRVINNLDHNYMVSTQAVRGETDMEGGEPVVEPPVLPHVFEEEEDYPDIGITEEEEEDEAQVPLPQRIPRLDNDTVDFFTDPPATATATWFPGTVTRR